MKKLLVISFVAVFMISPLFSDVLKKSRSEVTFGKFGTLKSLQTLKISSDKKLTDSDSSFKGKGLLGKAAAKTVLKAGMSSEIIDLSALIIVEINHKKKNFTKRPITPLDVDESAGQGQDPERGEKRESDIRIIRSEFKVKRTGETKTINQFPTEKYAISWITEWENTRTGQTGTDSLFSDVWTTPMTGELKSAHSQETSFSKAHMKALGINLDEIQQAMLGSNWMALLTQMGGGGQTQSGAEVSTEMQKIEGYPVLIDGKYFSKKEGGEETAESGKGVKKLLGGLAKKAFKKKKDDSSEPVLIFYTELLEFTPAQANPEDFQTPVGYKEKK